MVVGVGRRNAGVQSEQFAEKGQHRLGHAESVLVYLGTCPARITASRSLACGWRGWTDWGQ